MNFKDSEYMQRPGAADFISFCCENGINLDHDDDWLTWWKCFDAGIDVGLNYGDDDSREFD